MFLYWVKLRTEAKLLKYRISKNTYRTSNSSNFATLYTVYELVSLLVLHTCKTWSLPLVIILWCISAVCSVHLLEYSSPSLTQPPRMLIWLSPVSFSRGCVNGGMEMRRRSLQKAEISPSESQVSFLERSDWMVLTKEFVQICMDLKSRHLHPACQLKTQFLFELKICLYINI